MNRKISFRVTDTWYEKATTRAQELGVDLSEYVRNIISKDYTRSEGGSKMLGYSSEDAAFQAARAQKEVGLTGSGQECFPVQLPDGSWGYWTAYSVFNLETPGKVLIPSGCIPGKLWHAWSKGYVEWKDVEDGRIGGEMSLDKKSRLDIPILLDCGCKTVWHEGETLCLGAYAGLCEKHGDAHVAKILDPDFEEKRKRINGCPNGATTFDELLEQISSGKHDIDLKDLQHRLCLPDEWDWTDIEMMIEEGKLTADTVDIEIHRGLR